MSKSKRKWLIALLLVGLVLVAWLSLALSCPNSGIALTSRARNLHRLKNRSSVPQESDFDTGVTLEALLQSGDDTNRWSTSHSARIQGQVIDVAYARPEATNCYSPCRRDIHIVVARQKDAAKTQQVIVEVTPNMREWASQKGIDWSEETLHSQLIGRWVEFEGWMYFDIGHDEEAENTAPHRVDNWRATAWELHPVTKITVIN